MNDRNGRYSRIRYTATGALATLAAVGAIAGAAALAARPPAKAHAHAALANHGTKAPTSPAPDKTRTPRPANQQPFFNAVQQLVNNGTITATQGQALDRDIQSGSIDTDTLTGFTQAQLQAVERALGNAKRALAQAAPGDNGTTK